MARRKHEEKKRSLCCMIATIGSCRLCKKDVCATHGKRVSGWSTGRLLYVECLSSKCNDVAFQERKRAELRRRALMERTTVTRKSSTAAGKLLLTKINRSKSKI